MPRPLMLLGLFSYAVVAVGDPASFFWLCPLVVVLATFTPAEEMNNR